MTKHSLTPLATALGALSLAVFSQTACAQTGAAAATAPAPAAPAATTAKAPTALKIVDRKLGDGATAEANSPVAVHYTGYLWDAAAPDNKGKKFDSSVDRGIPFGFMLGVGRVIKGWDEGVVGMKVGGQRTLIIPPDKAYGDRGAGAAIPPGATLVFDVELMSVVGKTTNASATPSAYVPAPKQ